MLYLGDLVKFEHKRGVDLQRSEDNTVLLILETNLLTNEVQFIVIDKVYTLIFDSIEKAINKYNELDLKDKK
jgi:hypothetical protein